MLTLSSSYAKDTLRIEMFIQIQKRPDEPLLNVMY